MNYRNRRREAWELCKMFAVSTFIDAATLAIIITWG